MRTILHIDFNSYFATVEQQANPHLRGKPIGVTGGDRLDRTVLGAASVEAKKLGVKTGMPIWEAKKLCSSLILVKGDSDKYLECTKRFLAILSSYSPYLEVFSIDEAFLQVTGDRQQATVKIAQEIKKRIRNEIGEWITCSIGISYNKLMAKLAGSLYKPDGLVIIEDEKAAQFILDQIELDEICGIGRQIKKRLNNMGIFNFKQLRQVPFELAGETLYNMARGIDNSPIVPFYEKAEVKSIGHRHTIDHDTNNPLEIKQILLKLTELISRRLRAKKLVSKTVHCWYRRAGVNVYHPEGVNVNIMQITIPHISDGLEIFKAAWKIFHQIWYGGKIRMISVSVSNLKPSIPQNVSLLENIKRQETIVQALDKINDKYGEFTLQRGILLDSAKIYRKPNPFLSDRRFKL